MSNTDLVAVIAGIEGGIADITGSLSEIKRELLKRSAEASKPAPKVIDWDAVADCVPVKAWDDRKDAFILYPCHLIRQFDALDDWRHRSLITGIEIAWGGGDCPLPEGVMVSVRLRNAIAQGAQHAPATDLNWSWDAANCDIISFRVTGIHPDYTEATS